MEHEIIYCRTRTGTKVHKAHTTSSVTFCGCWLRVQANSMRVDYTLAELNDGGPRQVLCEHCFSEGEILKPSAPAAKYPREMTLAELRKTGACDEPGLRGQDARHQARYLLRTSSTQAVFAHIGAPGRFGKLVDEAVRGAVA